MKRLKVFVILMTCFAATQVVYGAVEQLRVMSCNIRSYTDLTITDEETGTTTITVDVPWSTRRPALVAFIKDVNPVVIGTQELTESVLSPLMTALGSNYTKVGQRRVHAKETANEYSCLIYRNDLLTLKDSATFWLSATPEVPGTKFAESALNRICTWAVFQDKRSGERFIFVNTHLDTKPVAKVRQAIVLQNKINWLRKTYGNLPIILTGDFNAKIAPIYIAMMNPFMNTPEWGLNDATLTCDHPSGYLPNIQETKPRLPIDHVFCSQNIQIDQVRFCSHYYNNVVITDHQPLLVDLHWEIADTNHWEIASGQQFQQWVQYVNNGHPRSSAILTDDIDLTGISLSPIGTENQPYNGSFEGKGHSISGYTYTATGSNAGLFGYVDSASIHDFSIVGTLICPNRGSGFGVIAHMQNSMVSHVYSWLNIQSLATDTVHHIGGVVGDMYGNSILSCCSYSGLIRLDTVHADCIGGVLGYVGEVNSGYAGIDNCAYYGEIACAGTTGHIGGILGYVNKAQFQGLRNCLGIGTSSSSIFAQIVGSAKALSTSSLKNNYYLSGSDAVHAGGKKSVVENTCTALTEASLTSGVAVKKLGSVYYQGTAYPLIGQGRSGVFCIRDEKDLVEFFNRVRNGYTTAKGVLMNDITMSSAWVPVSAFTGSLDGGMHTIYNFTNQVSTSGGNALVDTLYGSIHNLNIEGVLNCQGTNNGLVGLIYGGSLYNVHSYLNVNAINSSVTHTAGVAGGMTASDNFTPGFLDRCSYWGTMNTNGSTDCLAGILGYANIGYIKNCAFYGTIQSGSSGKVGGILGYVNNSWFKGISNCLGVGSGTGSTFAQLIGKANKLSMDSMANNYYLSGTTAIYAGDTAVAARAKCKAATQTQLADGTICSRLGSAYYQVVGEDIYPLLVEHSPSTPTDINEKVASGIEQETNEHTYKVLRDGQLLIIREGKCYSAQGARVY